MPNPHPTFFTTGKCETREELRRSVRTLRGFGRNWTEIADELGISDRTAKRVHDEEEALRKEARAAAYAAAGVISRKTTTAPVQTGLKAATMLYAGLLVVLLIIGALVAFHR